MINNTFMSDQFENGRLLNRRNLHKLNLSHTESQVSQSSKRKANDPAHAYLDS
jgi:hypothetical protein